MTVNRFPTSEFVFYEKNGSKLSKKLPGVSRRQAFSCFVCVIRLMLDPFPSHSLSISGNARIPVMTAASILIFLETTSKVIWMSLKTGRVLTPLSQSYPVSSS